MIQWKGVFPALTTKFKDNLQLDIPAFQKNLEAQIGAGIDGVIVGGSLGEASTITHEEKMELLKAALDTAKGRIPILVNIAERSTAAAVKIAEDAQAGGAQGLMALPPMQYKATDAEVVRYFQDIAQSTDLPILIYNNPVDYKIEVTLDMFETLLKEKNIQAVKESTRDISNVSRIISRFGDRLKVLCGVDTLAMEELVMGADGWVAGLVCAFPRETVVIYELAKQNRIAEALEIYRWFKPVLDLDVSTKLVQNIKLAEQMTGLGNENVRPPRLPLIGEERQNVVQTLQKALETRPIMPKL